MKKFIKCNYNQASELYEIREKMVELLNTVSTEYEFQDETIPELEKLIDDAKSIKLIDD